MGITEGQIIDSVGLFRSWEPLESFEQWSDMV